MSSKEDIFQPFFEIPDEVAAQLHQFSSMTPEASPSSFNGNQYVILFRNGQRKLKTCATAYEAMVEEDKSLIERVEISRNYQGSGRVI